MEAAEAAASSDVVVELDCDARGVLSIMPRNMDKHNFDKSQMSASEEIKSARFALVPFKNTQIRSSYGSQNLH